MAEPRTVEQRPVLHVWRQALKPRETAALQRAILGKDWVAGAWESGVIATGELRAPRARVFDAIRPFGAGFQGVACTEAQMHSDEHLKQFRWNVLGLIACPSNQARVTTVNDDLTVSTGFVHPGDMFVLDIHRAHAAHPVGVAGLGLMLFWSLLLPGCTGGEEAHALAQKLSRWFGEARDTWRRRDPYRVPGQTLVRDSSTLLEG